MFSLARTATIASLHCRLVGYWVPSGKLSAKRETPLRSYFGIRRSILGRITFYDIESRPMQKNLTDHEKRFYLREIAYFNRFFRRADLSIDISGSSLDDASRRVWDVLKPARRERSNAWSIALL